ncbi:MAG TPA: 16S rRNA (cytosine(1402)-N(4))-methyltransferase RsmH [Terriglobales bacterium]|nr:16S rRNA (cytosine(1402)-N(4))-methyltransferase RsmH [Terriglobales bacterium]
MEDIKASQEAGHGEGGGSQRHVPVLLEEAIHFLNVRRGGTYIDATLGLGGHACAIARRLGPQGHLIGFDKDPKALELARKRLDELAAELGSEAPTVTLIHGSYAEVGQRVGPAGADGLLADLGLSSMQLADAARGFSFQAEGPLDMRMDIDPRNERTAEQVVNHLDESDLADVIYEFGEERRSRRIARAIVRARPLRSTAHLAQVVTAALPAMKYQRIHPATTTFQAIRIFVNRELEDLKTLLDVAPQVLLPSIAGSNGGRLVVISFHSLEDRMVKQAIREGAKDGVYRLLTKKPVTASDAEVDRNPRARSAKLRAAERTDATERIRAEAVAETHGFIGALAPQRG